MVLDDEYGNINLEADISIGAIAAGVSRIEGLYTKLAQKHGVPYGLIQVLYILRLNNPVTQKQISEYCEIPKQTVNSMIKQLKADNHITLIANDEDKREKKIQLTPIGKVYSQETLKPFLELNKMVVNKIGMDLLLQLSKKLKTLGDAIELEIELKTVSSKWEKKGE